MKYQLTYIINFHAVSSCVLSDVGEVYQRIIETINVESDVPNPLVGYYERYSSDIAKDLLMLGTNIKTYDIPNRKMAVPFMTNTEARGTLLIELV